MFSAWKEKRCQSFGKILSDCSDDLKANTMLLLYLLFSQFLSSLSSLCPDCIAPFQIKTILTEILSCSHYWQLKCQEPPITQLFPQTIHSKTRSKSSRSLSLTWTSEVRPQSSYHLPDLHNVVFRHRADDPGLVGVPGEVWDLGCVASMDKLHTGNIIIFIMLTQGDVSNQKGFSRLQRLTSSSGGPSSASSGDCSSPILLPNRWKSFIGFLWHQTTHPTLPLNVVTG